MDVIAATGIPTHGAEGFLGPNVPQITRVLRPVTQAAECFAGFRAGIQAAVGIAPGPAADESATAQDDFVVHRHPATAPNMPQLGGAVTAAKGEAEGMLG